jgi:murein DD-endopeptidase MepM/ murein hydrolase activator NlpD
MGTPLARYDGTPTPDPSFGAGANNPDGTMTHTVNAGETLGAIAQLYGSTVEELQSLNGLSNVDFLQVGQTLRVPAGQSATEIGTDFKIIPDSELVYGPAARGFDVRALLAALDSHLLRYEEEVEGRPLTGPEIVQLVADRTSVNPRLLLAVIEHRTGWVTQPEGATSEFHLGNGTANASGLYNQLSWAANQLNWGYYGRAEGGLNALTVGGVTLLFAPNINHGTAGVQLFLASHDDATYETWLQDAGPGGFAATYRRLFGNPFAYTVDPIYPPDLQAPALLLPWSPGETWYLTGGPHGGWNTGSAWAALDFAPPADQLGCVSSDAWVTAMADGIVTRSDFGAVVVDLDGDGYSGTGWAITYMHLETRDRIASETAVRAGDRLGHPSCEGGFSNGTHLHIARTYNGRWIAADGSLPFNMTGWVSQGLGAEYDGLLLRNGESKEACVCRDASNAIGH